MSFTEFFELASFVVSDVAAPFAIYTFIDQQRKARENEEEAAYVSLSESYNRFLTLVLENPDLHLRTARHTLDLTADQQERVLVIFEMLVSLFERAYLLLYEPELSPKAARRWNSWTDYMHEWCRREDFRLLLPRMLEGEDPEFAAFLRALAAEEAAKAAADAP
jgi:hypothetical protein